MNTRKKYYSEKIVKSGNLIEHLKFERPVSVKRSTHPDYIKPVGRAKTADEQGKKQNRYATLKKNRKTVERLIHANSFKWADDNGEVFHPIFLTLTYSENLENIDVAYKHFKTFVQRLNWHVYKQRVGKLKYVAVIEFQKRGAIHFHCVFFNLPFIEGDELTTIWKHGMIHAGAVKHVGKIANYLTKKMTYAVRFDPMAGRKRYLTSQGLIKPQKTINDKEIEQLIANSEQTYAVEFENDYYGKIEYERRTIKRKPKKK